MNNDQIKVLVHKVTEGAASPQEKLAVLTFVNDGFLSLKKELQEMQAILKLRQSL